MPLYPILIFYFCTILTLISILQNGLIFSFPNCTLKIHPQKRWQLKSSNLGQIQRQWCQMQKGEGSSIRDLKISRRKKWWHTWACIHSLEYPHAPQIEMKFISSLDNPVNGYNMCNVIFGRAGMTRHKEFKPSLRVWVLYFQLHHLPPTPTGN